jgi:hypothetical protein
VDDGRRLVFIRAQSLLWLGQSRVGCIEQRGDAPPREMIAQAGNPLDRMRLIDQPEVVLVFFAFGGVLAAEACTEPVEVTAA